MERVLKLSSHQSLTIVRSTPEVLIPRGTAHQMWNDGDEDARA